MLNQLFDLTGKVAVVTGVSQGIVSEHARLAEQASNVDRLIKNTPYELSETEILNIYQKAYQGFVLDWCLSSQVPNTIRGSLDNPSEYLSYFAE